MRPNVQAKRQRKCRVARVQKRKDLGNARARELCKPRKSAGKRANVQQARGKRNQTQRRTIRVQTFNVRNVRKPRGKRFNAADVRKRANVPANEPNATRWRARRPLCAQRRENPRGNEMKTAQRENDGMNERRGSNANVKLNRGTATSVAKQPGRTSASTCKPRMQTAACKPTCNVNAAKKVVCR